MPAEPLPKLQLAYPRSRVLLPAAANLLLLAIAVLSAATAESYGWLAWSTAVVWGVFLGCCISELLSPSQLVLDEIGFARTFGLVRFERRRSWSDCSEFVIGRRGRSAFYNVPNLERTRLRRLNQATVHTDELLSTGYGGYQPPELVALLNQYRAAVLGLTTFGLMVDVTCVGQALDRLDDPSAQ